MEPRIQYATSADGTSIALMSAGEGEPAMLRTPVGFLNQFESDLEAPGARAFDEALARTCQVVRYDMRGTGLSERGARDFSLAAQTADIAAVADRLQLQQFVLVAVTASVPAAIVYALEQPGRVSHLILFDGRADLREDWASSARLAAITSLAGRDWNLYAETVAREMYGWSEEELTRVQARQVRQATDAATLEAYLRATREISVRDRLDEVETPTLVVQVRGEPDGSAGPAAARLLAASIRDAQLFETDFRFAGDADPAPLVRTIRSFVGQDDGERPDRPDEEAPEDGAPSVVARPTSGAIHTILFTDIEGSTALTQRLGDAAAREVFRAHERITREALRAHGGSEVKALGDGFMATFHSPSRALECATAMQQAFEGEAGVGRHGIRVRVGVNAGEPIAEDDDLFGTAVILAARIAAQADGGEVLVSDVVRQLVAGKGFAFEERGMAMLKGFDAPARLHQLRWRQGGG